MVATVEAKAEHIDVSSVLDYQCKDYSRNIRVKDSEYVISTSSCVFCVKDGVYAV